jgi:hypothetical protein
MSYVSRAEFSISTEAIDVVVHKHAPEDTHYDHMDWARGHVVVPRDMWVTGLSTHVEGAPHGTLHNAYLMLEDENDPRCPANPALIWSGGTVTTRTPMRFDAPYGIFLKEGQTLLLEAAFHNGNLQGIGADHHDVTFTVEFEYEKSGAGTRTKPLRFSTIDPTGCDRHRPIFTIAPYAQRSAYDSTQSPFIFERSADILAAGAHFHGSYDDGVTNTMRLFLNGKLLEEFNTTNITDGNSRNPLLLIGRTPIPVRMGDALTMEALFDNPAKTPVYEGMAIVGFYYAEY